MGQTKSLWSWKRLICKSNNSSIVEASNNFSAPIKRPSEAVDGIFLPLETPPNKRQAMNRGKLFRDGNLSPIRGYPVRPNPNRLDFIQPNK